MNYSLPRSHLVVKSAAPLRAPSLVGAIVLCHLLVTHPVRAAGPAQASPPSKVASTPARPLTPGSATPSKPSPSSPGAASSAGTAPAKTATPAVAWNKPLASALSGDARTSYEAGKILFADGDYAGAFRKFGKANELSGDPRLLWNMAVCQKNLRHYTRVSDLLHQYLKEGAGHLSRADEREATALIGAVREFISTVTVAVNVDGAQVSLDSEPVGTSPLEQPLAVDIGDHQISVEKEGFRKVTQKLSLSGQSQETVTIQMQKQSAHLVVEAAEADIRLNGKLLLKDKFDGEVPVGRLLLRVTASGKKTYETEILLVDGETRRLHVDLESETNLWLWAGIIGGAAAATSVGVYFLTQSGDREPEVVEGSIATVRLPFVGR